MNSTLRRKEITQTKFKSILCLSDQHHPYEHKDLIPFLKELNNKYRFDLVVNMGDEVDFHAINFHEKEPGAPSYSDELDLAIAHLKPLYKLFPNMQILDSNHGSLVFRKGKSIGLPARVFKSPREILLAPLTWNWCGELIVNSDCGLILFKHGMTSVAGKFSQRMGMHTVQGHYHSKFQITYWGNPLNLNWDMHVGCVVDDTSLAMAYNKLTLERPVIGVGVIENGRPKLVPMLLNKHGRWVGRI